MHSEIITPVTFEEKKPNSILPHNVVIRHVLNFYSSMYMGYGANYLYLCRTCSENVNVDVNTLYVEINKVKERTREDVLMRMFNVH